MSSEPGGLDGAVPTRSKRAEGCCRLLLPLEVGQPELQKYPLPPLQHAGECGAPLSPHNL